MEQDTKEDILRIFEKQKQRRWEISQSSAPQRIERLQRLYDNLESRREQLYTAINNDFHKHRAETELTEMVPTLLEIKHTIKHLSRWMRHERASTPLVLWGTKSEIHYEAKGQVLILSPWNYPVMLTLTPLIGAIAAGNVVMLRPSEKTAKTALFLKELITSTFDESEVAMFVGPTELANVLLDLPFDHIFFTGSPRVGKMVMEKAAKHLASVTLELGGKSPTIIDETADVAAAAERVVWGKFINAGQTCIAPDYVFVHQSRVDVFINECKKTLQHFYGATESEQKRSQDFARIIDLAALQRLQTTLEQTIAQGARIEAGGAIDVGERYIAPTLLSQVQGTMPIMANEIFGPILPVMTFNTLDEVTHFISAHDKPLALYFFSKSPANIKQMLSQTSSGGTLINNTVIHIGNSNLPFGGVGLSGLGNYHGHFGFKTFSHARGVMHQRWPNLLKFFYPPYSKRTERFLEWVNKVG